MREGKTPPSRECEGPVKIIYEIVGEKFHVFIVHFMKISPARRVHRGLYGFSSSSREYFNETLLQNENWDREIRSSEP